MPKEINFNQTWWGYGYKYGGILIAAGFETTEGFIYNAKSFSWREKFTLTNIRLGGGIGGSLGAVAVLAFNTPSLGTLDGMQISDWGVNIAMGAKFSAMFNAMKKKELLPSDLESIRNGLHHFYNYFDVATRDDAPKVVSIDLGGIGAELSANYVTGKFVVDWGVAG